MGRQMGRELRDDRPHRSQRVGQRQVMFGGSKLHPALLGSHLHQVCRKRPLHCQYGAFHLEALRMLRGYRKTRSEKCCGHCGDIGTAGPELRFELGRRQPLMIVSRSWIGLFAQELFESVAMRQWQIDVEMRHLVWACGSDRLDVRRVRRTVHLRRAHRRLCAEHHGAYNKRMDSHRLTSHNCGVGLSWRPRVTGPCRCLPRDKLYPSRFVLPRTHSAD